jgi:protease IV
MSNTPPPGQDPVPFPGHIPPPPGSYPPGSFPPGGFPTGPMPPMMIPPPPPAEPRGGGFARAMLITLATTLFGASLMLNIFLLVALAGKSVAGGGAIGMINETVVVPGDSANRVAVVKLDGAIMDENKADFLQLIDRVSQDTTIRALVIEINSPGGGVTASDEIYNAVVRLKKSKNIKVYASFDSLAASGGYYVACAADEIYAQRTTLTGSIGVIFSRFDMSEFAQKYGIRDGSVVSDGAFYKDAGSMFKPLTNDQTVYFKSILNDAFGTFKSVVTTGRGTRLRGNIDDIANGKIYSAAQAKALGLVDGDQHYLTDVVDIAIQSTKIINPAVIRYERMPTFFEQLSGGRSASISAGVTIDEKLVQRMATPRLMYLWPGQ